MLTGTKIWIITFKNRRMLNSALKALVKQPKPVLLSVTIISKTPLFRYIE